MPNRLIRACILSLAAAAGSVPALAQDNPPPPGMDGYEPISVEKMRLEAARVMPMLDTAAARMFLLSTSFLPVPAPRTLHINRAEQKVLTDAEFNQLPEEARAGYEARELDDHYFYYTGYGTPLAYARPLDIAAAEMQRRGKSGNVFKGTKIFDFGFGSIGHLRMLASLGADVRGVEVDPILEKLYSEPDDTGFVEKMGLNEDVTDGTLTLAFGKWPADEVVKDKIGGGYDLILSKNTLKNGYLNPEKEVDPRRLVHLGVEQREFVETVFAALKPGGLFLIYNLSPKQSEEQYMPWADGRCPFPKGMFEAAGFEVIAFDVDDSKAARRLGDALMWNQGPRPMNLEEDLFGLYTLVRKPDGKNGHDHGDHDHDGHDHDHAGHDHKHDGHDHK